MLIRTLLFKILTAFEDKGFEDAEKASKELKKEAKETTKEVKKLGDSLEKTETKAAGAGKAAKKTAKGVGLLDRAMAKAKKRAEGLGPEIKQAFATAAGGLISSGIQKLISSVGDGIALVGEKTAELDAIAKDAQKTGFGVGDFQRLAHVATLSGTEVAVLAKGITNLEIQLDVIGRGGAGPAAEALADLGLSYKDLTDKDPTEQLKIVSKALEQFKDPADRSRIAFKLMGEEGRQLIPLFNGGADAIQGMVDATGKVFSRAELAKAEAYQDVLAGMNKRSSDLKGTLALGLVPIFERVLTVVDLIIPKVEAWAREVAKPFQRLIEAIKPFVDDFGPGFIELLEFAVEPITDMIERAAFFADVLATVLEVGGQLLAWIQDLLGEIETRWPVAFEKAGSVVNAFLSPLETARSIISEIFDFISRSASEIEGVSETIDDIKGAIGLGTGGGGLSSTAAATSAFRAAQQSQAGAEERKRSQEDRRKDRAAARSEGRSSFARGEAGALTRRAGRRGRGGGGGGGGASAATEETGFLESLDLTAPGTVMAGRPLPQNLTIIFAPIIKAVETLIINVEGGGTPEQDRKLQDAATQARDAVMAKLSDIAPAVNAMFETREKKLRAMAGGGKTPRGA